MEFTVKTLGSPLNIEKVYCKKYYLKEYDGIWGLKIPP